MIGTVLTAIVLCLLSTAVLLQAGAPIWATIVTAIVIAVVTAAVPE